MRKVNRLMAVAMGLITALYMAHAISAQTQPAGQAQQQVEGQQQVEKQEQAQATQQGQRSGQRQRTEQTQRSRRSQRVVPLKEIQVASPDGNIKFTLLPNAERLSFTVTMGDTTVVEPSPIVMNLDGYDLSSGVVFNKLERYQIDESYPWLGATARR